MKITLLFALTIFALPLAVSAELLPEQELRAQEIFSSVMSPYCPGRLLNDCPSEKAHTLKENIREKISQGKTPEQIENDIYAEFGEALRASPRPSGFGLLAWLIPALFLIVGGGIIVAWVRRPVINDQSLNNEAEIDPELEIEIEKELDKI